MAADGSEQSLRAIRCAANIFPPARTHIVQEAMDKHFGGVVLDRRGLITFIDEYFVGRVSDQVLKLADQLAVQII